MDVVERQVCVRHAVGRSACRGAILVVLLDDNVVNADVREWRRWSWSLYKEQTPRLLHASLRIAAKKSLSSQQMCRLG